MFDSFTFDESVVRISLGLYNTMSEHSSIINDKIIKLFIIQEVKRRCIL